jgi:glucose/mannose-6-phosphate isomerase
MTLDDAAHLAQLDAHDTRAVLAAFPAQCREALALRPEPAPTLRRPRLVVVAAMGGSAAGGDLVAACAAEHIDVPILVHRGYGLPALVGERDLVIASSYSGDTVEVLSAAEAALSRQCALLVVTSGGQLGALAAAHSLSRVALPPRLMPRMALGYLLFPLLSILRAADLAAVKDAEVDEALEVLQALAGELDTTRPTERNEAKLLALAIGGRLPVIYGGPGTGSAAYRWKTDFEENAKLFAAAGVLPEMNHNEIEAWRTARAGELQLVLLRERGEIPDITRRFALLRELVDGAAGGISEAWARGASALARVLSLVYLGQWTSYYLAMLAGVDPWPVPTLDALKARLRERE